MTPRELYFDGFDRAYQARLEKSGLAPLNRSLIPPPVKPIAPIGGPRPGDIAGGTAQLGSTGQGAVNPARAPQPPVQPSRASQGPGQTLSMQPPGGASSFYGQSIGVPAQANSTNNSVTRGQSPAMVVPRTGPTYDPRTGDQYSSTVPITTIDQVPAATSAVPAAQPTGLNFQTQSNLRRATPLVPTLNSVANELSHGSGQFATTPTAATTSTPPVVQPKVNPAVKSTPAAEDKPAPAVSAPQRNTGIMVGGKPWSPGMPVNQGDPLTQAQYNARGAEQKQYDDAEAASRYTGYNPSQVAGAPPRQDEAYRNEQALAQANQDTARQGQATTAAQSASNRAWQGAAPSPEFMSSLAQTSDASQNAERQRVQQYATNPNQSFPSPQSFHKLSEAYQDGVRSEYRRRGLVKQADKTLLAKRIIERYLRPTSPRNDAPQQSRYPELPKGEATNSMGNNPESGQ